MAGDVEAVLGEFFVLTDEGWTHTRCDEEIEKMHDKQAKARKSAQASVNARRANVERSLQEQSTGVERSLDKSVTDVELPTPTPTPTPTPKNKEEAQAPLPDWIPAEAWDGYAEMRKKIRKPMTARAQALVLKTLAGIRDRGFDVEAALDNSTRNGWIDVYEPKASAATAAGVKRGSEEYAALHRNASWWRDAGFESVWDAINAKCWHDNADKYRDGKRVEVAA